jgi:hypothetical protein
MLLVLLGRKLAELSLAKNVTTCSLFKRRPRVFFSIGIAFAAAFAEPGAKRLRTALLLLLVVRT